MNGQEPLATCWGILSFYRNICGRTANHQKQKGETTVL